MKGEIYIALNMSHLPFRVTLPDCPGYRWEPLVDTSKPSPYDFLTPDLPGRDIAIQQYAQFLDANMYPMLSYSSIILLRIPDENPASLLLSAIYIILFLVCWKRNRLISK